MFMLEDLAKKIGVEFNDIEVLKQAMTHRSYLNEHRDYKLPHNERLEFLGDAVLELIVTEYLYKNYPDPEGDMTNWRAALVNGEMLSKIARKIGLEEYLMMSRGETKDTGRARQYLLANAFEAVIGAIYLDQEEKPASTRGDSSTRLDSARLARGGGYIKAREFILKNVLSELPEIIENELYLDPKSRFQEEAQDKVGVTPSYRSLEESGPDHDRKFLVGVYLDEELIAKGEGKSKQEAQRKAAEQALEVKHW